MPQTHVTNKVITVVESIASNSPEKTLSVLDLSCGDGEIIQTLKRKGFKVTGTRYKENDYILSDKQAHDFDVVNNVDLTKDLPFQPEIFDIVIATEVLEHLLDHRKITSEACRILKNGGVFIFTTPNIHRLHSRFRFLLTGTHKLIRRRVGCDIQKDNMYEYHINPVDLPLYHVILYQEGFVIDTLIVTKFKLKHLFWLLFYPIVFLACFVEMMLGKSSNKWWRAGEKRLFKLMTSFPLLYSEQLFAICRKRTRE